MISAMETFIEIWHEPRADSRQPTELMRAFLLVMGLVVAACGDNPPVVYPTVAPFDVTRLALGPGDRIELTVYYGAKEIKATYTLDAAGQMEVQYIGTVEASKKTVRDIQSEIQTRLADGYLRDPVVSLTVVEINSLKCSVIGHVVKNGTVKFTPGLTITEVIAQSGGFTPLARKNMVRVTRGKETYKIPVELIAEGQRPNFPMMPGDEVFVPERSW
jgi:protein involved in polysaccharide export with SLBB domain